MVQKNLEYNIGLDIGTNSVGWAVTDIQNNILKKGKKNMWGARTFDEGKTTAETRNYRGARRRIQRRKNRIEILQNLLYDDVEKEYPNFFKMLEETYKVQEDKTYNEKIDGKKYNIFSELGFTDKEYYKKYPTIYHLRYELMNNKEKQDIRLVYLAIHHIIKYRGNFLYEGDLTNSDNITEDIETLLNYISENLKIDYIGDDKQILKTLSDKKLQRGEKKDILLKLFDYGKDDKSIITAIISAILGTKFDLSAIFEIDLGKTKISFNEEIQNEDEIKEKLQDNVYIYEVMQRIYNWMILQEILDSNGENNTSISKAYINKFDKYKQDLELLKNVYKKHLKSKYNSMFRIEESDNYVSYNGKDTKNKKCTIDQLYKRIQNDLKSIDSCNEKEQIIKEIENESFLKKLNTTDNAAIPYQLHFQELKQILQKQGIYYPTINKNKELILQLMKFRIPYYVGPLEKNTKNRFAWIERKTDEKILPWTFDRVVDINTTAEKFIRRMTNKCTYLIKEDVIPKQSILYSKFCVLNELANIRVNGQKLSPQVKQLIIEKLFKKQKNVKRLDLVKMLLDNQIYTHIDSITGFAEEDKFMSNMASYIDMNYIFKIVNKDNINMIEQIIEWITVYEDKEILKHRLDSYKLPDNIIKQLVGLKYTGWSRLSRKLLNGLKSIDNGMTIIEKLENTKENFMQIINNKKYGFDKQIEELSKIDKDKLTYDDIKNIPTSPANKKAIWQTVKIVKEIVKVMKKEPKNIYVEFARNEEEKGKRKDNRAKKLLKIYENHINTLKEIKNYDPDVYKELKGKLNEKDFNERLYLYFIQNGKCMYSMKPLNFQTLNLYEVDHILPQSYIKDDSLENKALVYKEENQRKSDSLLLDEKIIRRQEEWWKQLYENGFIGEKKLKNLTRRKVYETDDEKAKFVARQLVETRQSTKYITNLLVNLYKKTDIYAIRAEFTHAFREFFNIYKNRNINDYHHAQDAYIISVVGNVIDTKLHYKDEYKYKEYVKNYIKEEEKKNQEERKKKWIVMGMIANNINIEQVKKTLNYKDCFITHKLEEGTGQFYDQTIYSPYDKSKRLEISIKENKDTNKYGGYSGEKKAYFVICSYYDAKNRKQAELIGVPVKVSYDIKNKKTSLLDYIQKYLAKDNGKVSNVKILKNKILKYQEYINENNEPIILLSDSEIKANKQLFVNEDINEIIYQMNRNNITDEEKKNINRQMENLYEYFLEKMHTEYMIFEGTYKKLIRDDVRECFNNLVYEDKVFTINGIIDLMKKGQGNLSKLQFKEGNTVKKLGDREGRKTKFFIKTDKLKNITFIDKSITGMYERRYKIDGLEDNCSK